MSIGSEPFRTLVVGLGNPLRRDDGVGLIVAARLREVAPEGCAVLAWAGSPIDLIERWRGAVSVILVDALAAEEPAGTLRRFDAARDGLARRTLRASSHLLDAAEVVELARELGRLPARLIVYGVVGADFSIGEGLSPGVGGAVPGIVERIRRELGARAHHAPRQTWSLADSRDEP